MGTYNRALATKLLYESGFSILSTETLKQLFSLNSDKILYKVLRDLLEAKVIKKLEASKYMLIHSNPPEFLTANLLYEPSYVSFESALNFYGILPQFPFSVTSTTTNKTITKTIDSKTFVYTQLKESLYWGFVKRDGFLIAEPEKALLDYMYLATKGLKSDDFSEYNLNPINKVVLNSYLKKFKLTVSHPKIEIMITKILNS